MTDEAREVPRVISPHIDGTSAKAASGVILRGGGPVLVDPPTSVGSLNIVVRRLVRGCQT